MSLNESSCMGSAHGAETPSVRRVALLSVHTCPLDQPGTGDSGGMNVYVRAVARMLAEMGVAVDIFSRWAGGAEKIREADPGVRVIHLEAGPERPVPKEELGAHLGQFLYSLLRFEAAETERPGADGSGYDVVHAHYWLSGWVGQHAAERWEIPFVHSFHTLGRVKNRTRADGDTAEPVHRIVAEERIVQTADCVLAPTETEARELITLYGARPDAVRVVSPGVDTDLFRPEADRDVARRALGVHGKTLVLFVGRLQPLKAPDVAIRAIAQLARTRPHLDPVLMILGGPSGEHGATPEALRALALAEGVVDRVLVREPVPHADLPSYYQAADAVLIPSRSESFGLVALEAAACGTPVVATDVGGLRTAVRHGRTGLLVPGGDPFAYARALAGILDDHATAKSMRDAAVCHARRFDWRMAASGLLGVYEEQMVRATAAAG